jgi:hypothetical protein
MRRHFLGMNLLRKGFRSASSPQNLTNQRNSWKYVQGTGCWSPAASSLKTNQYLVLSNGAGLIIELFYGSTGSVIYQNIIEDGPNSKVIFCSLLENVLNFYEQDVTGILLSISMQGIREDIPRWIGWDGSIIYGLHGRTDFSSWLAPDLVSRVRR